MSVHVVPSRAAALFPPLESGRGSVTAAGGLLGGSAALQLHHERRLRTEQTVPSISVEVDDDATFPPLVPAPVRAWDPASLVVLRAADVAAGQLVPGEAAPTATATAPSAAHFSVPSSPTHAARRGQAQVQQTAQTAAAVAADRMLLPRSLFFPTPPAVTQRLFDEGDSPAAPTAAQAGNAAGKGVASSREEKDAVPVALFDRRPTALVQRSHGPASVPALALSARGPASAAAAGNKRRNGARPAAPHTARAASSTATATAAAASSAVAANSGAPVPPASNAHSHVRRASLYSSFGPKVVHRELDPLVVAQTQRSEGAGPLNRAQMTRVTIDSLTESLRENLPPHPRAWDCMSDMTNVEPRRPIAFVTASTFQYTHAAASLVQQQQQREPKHEQQRLLQQGEGGVQHQRPMDQSAGAEPSAAAVAAEAAVAAAAAAASAVIELPTRAQVDTEPSWRRALQEAAGYVLYVPARHLLDEGAAVVAELLQREPRITKLDARANGFTPAACAAILAALPRSGLRVLDLSAMHGFPLNHLGLRGAHALKLAFQTGPDDSAMPPVRGCALRALRLQSIGSQGILNLINLQTFEFGMTLRILDLRGNNIGQAGTTAAPADGNDPAGAAVLGGGGGLVVQNSSHSALGGAAAAAGRTAHKMLAAAHEASLAQSLTSPRGGASAAAASTAPGDDDDDLDPLLQQGPPLAHDTLLIRLCKSLRASRVEKLLLSHNALSEGQGGGDAIVGLLSNPAASITHLDLGHNRFGRGFAALLGGMLTRDRHALTQLCLEHNPLGDRGASAIAAGLCANSTLKYLSMRGCGLSKTASERSPWGRDEEAAAAAAAAAASARDRGRSEPSAGEVGGDSSSSSAAALSLSGSGGAGGDPDSSGSALNLMGPHDESSTSWTEMLRSNQVLLRLDLSANLFSSRQVAKLFRYGLSVNQTLATLELAEMKLTDEPRVGRTTKARSKALGLNAMSPDRPAPTPLPPEQNESSLVASLIYALRHRIDSPDASASATASASTSTASSSSGSNLQVLDLRHNALTDSFALGLYSRVVHQDAARTSLRAVHLAYNHVDERLVRALQDSMATNSAAMRHKSLRHLVAQWNDLKGCEMQLEKTNHAILRHVDLASEAEEAERHAHAELRRTRAAQVEETNALVRELARVEAERHAATQELSFELVRLQALHARAQAERESRATNLRGELAREKKRMRALQAHQAQVDSAYESLLPLRNSGLAELAALQAAFNEEDAALMAAKRDACSAAFRLVMTSGRVLRSYTFFLALYASQARSLRVARRTRTAHLVAYSKANASSLADTHRLLAAIADRAPNFAANNLKYFDVDIEDFCNWFFDAYTVQLDASKRVPMQLWALLLMEQYLRVPPPAPGMPPAQPGSGAHTPAAALPPSAQTTSGATVATQSLSLLQPSQAALLAAHQLLSPSALHSPASSTAIVAPSLLSGPASPSVLADYTHFVNLQLCYASAAEWADSAHARKQGQGQGLGLGMQQMIGGVPMLGAVKPPRTHAHRERLDKPAAADAAGGEERGGAAGTDAADGGVVLSLQLPSPDASDAADVASKDASTHASAPVPLSPSPSPSLSPPTSPPISPPMSPRTRSSLAPSSPTPMSPRAGSSASISASTSASASAAALAATVQPVFLWESRLLSSFDVPIGSTLLLLLREEARASVHIKARVVHGGAATGAAAGPRVSTINYRGVTPGSLSASSASLRSLGNGIAVSASTGSASGGVTEALKSAGDLVGADADADEDDDLVADPALQLHAPDSNADSVSSTATAPVTNFYAQQIQKLQSPKPKRGTAAATAAATAPTAQTERGALSTARRRRRSLGPEDASALSSTRSLAASSSSSSIAAAAAASKRSSSVDAPANRSSNNRRVSAATGSSNSRRSTFSLSLAHQSSSSSLLSSNTCAEDSADAGGDTLHKGSGGIIRLGGGLVRTRAEDEAVRAERHSKLQKLMRKKARLEKKSGPGLAAAEAASQLAQHNTPGGAGGGGTNVIAQTFPALSFHTLHWHEIGLSLNWSVGQLLEHVLALFGLGRGDVLDMQYVPGLKAQMLEPNALISATLNAFRTGTGTGTGPGGPGGRTLHPSAAGSRGSSSVSASGSASPCLSPLPDGSVSPMLAQRHTFGAGGGGGGGGLLDNIDESVENAEGGSRQNRGRRTGRRSVGGRAAGASGAAAGAAAGGSSSSDNSAMHSPHDPTLPGPYSSAFGAGGRFHGQFGMADSGQYGTEKPSASDSSGLGLGLGVDLSSVMTSPALQEMLQAALGEAARLERQRLKRHRKAMALREAALAREKAAAAGAADRGFYDGVIVGPGDSSGAEGGAAATAEEAALLEAGRRSRRSKRQSASSDASSGTTISSAANRGRKANERRGGGGMHHASASVDVSSGSGKMRRRPSVLSSARPRTQASSSKGSYDFSAGARMLEAAMAVNNGGAGASASNHGLAVAAGGGSGAGSRKAMSMEEIAAATASIAKEVQGAKARNAARKAAASGLGPASAADGDFGDTILEHGPGGDGGRGGDSSSQPSPRRARSRGVSEGDEGAEEGEADGQAHDGTEEGAVRFGSQRLSASTAAALAALASAASPFTLYRGFHAPSAESLDFREDVAAATAVLAQHRAGLAARAEAEQARRDRVAARKAVRTAADLIGAEFLADDYDESEYTHEWDAPGETEEPRAQRSTSDAKEAGGKKPSTAEEGATRSSDIFTFAAGTARPRSADRTVAASSASPAKKRQPATKEKDKDKAAAAAAAAGVGSIPLVESRWPTSVAQRMDLESLAEKLARWGSGLGKPLAPPPPVLGVDTDPATAAVAVSDADRQSPSSARAGRPSVSIGTAGLRRLPSLQVSHSPLGRPRRISEPHSSSASASASPSNRGLRGGEPLSGVSPRPPGASSRALSRRPSASFVA